MGREARSLVKEYAHLVSSLCQRTARLQKRGDKKTCSCAGGEGEGADEDEPVTVKHIGMKILIKW